MNSKVLVKFTPAVALAVLFVSIAPVWAQPVLNPDNGHFYEVIFEDRGIEGVGWNWQEAADAAAAMSFSGLVGHLVTVTSQEENDFLENAMDIPQNAWVGGVQDPAGSEPAGGWGWITGEPWSFTSWGSGEPNDFGGEDCLQWWSPDGTWNDRGCEETFDAFVVEYDGDGTVPARATFAVQKAYSDDNPGAVDVTIRCNTGLPLEQTYPLDPDRTGNTYVEFVVVDFNSGEMDCEITEESLAAYTPTYLYWIDDENFGSGDSCVFQNVEHGEVAVSNPESVHNVCFIGNTLNESEVTVHKEWIDENPEFNPVNYATANWFCSNLPIRNFIFSLPVLNEQFNFGPQLEGTGITDSGSLQFFDNPGVDTFLTYGNWDGGTLCTVTEQIVETGVEVDASDCDRIIIGPGENASCLIVNTRLFEGIPTLSQYGLALLAMLMLGIGLVAFRRVT